MSFFDDDDDQLNTAPLPQPSPSTRPRPNATSTQSNLNQSETPTPRLSRKKPAAQSSEDIDTSTLPQKLSGSSGRRRSSGRRAAQESGINDQDPRPTRERKFDGIDDLVQSSDSLRGSGSFLDDDMPPPRRQTALSEDSKKPRRRRMFDGSGGAGDVEREMDINDMLETVQKVTSTDREKLARRNTRVISNDANEIMVVIPDITDVEEESLQATVAAPPSLKVNRVRTLRELETELEEEPEYQTSQSGLNLSLLSSAALAPRDQVNEDDKPWSFDVIFAQLADFISTELATKDPTSIAAQMDQHFISSVLDRREETILTKSKESTSRRGSKTLGGMAGLNDSERKETNMLAGILRETKDRIGSRGSLKADSRRNIFLDD